MAFLAHIKALFPPSDAGSVPSTLWAIIAAVAFSSANVPEAVPAVFKSALEDLDEHDPQEQIIFSRKMREAVLMSGLLSGMPRAINSLVALRDATPEHLRESKPLRDTARPPAEWDKRGDEVFRAVYRDSADSVQKLLYDAYPDLGWFATTVGYGMTYGGTDVLSTRELVYVQVAALVAVDAPRQVGWHLANARAGGASAAEVRAVRRIAMDVAARAGVVWRRGVPDLEDADRGGGDG
ncbi:uncharacterized protein BXZ73DRAFT_105284 [Epithele typhae]|uniref:uncharacterized protein n=1 Tax=Epithele typhae TaxID=378194 RepID=UPI00200820D9|nr:uncharacterized protein BXZ73DRAFT_105284 [Epithele typhae]KAH9918409.1 hypothetical protein BXZ73DRAFT_105284 [Epithele typhae]